MNRIINIIIIFECILCTTAYIFAVCVFYNQLSLVRGIIGVLSLIIGNLILLFFLTDIFNFDINKIYGFKYEVFVLGMVFQLTAFVLLKNKML